MSATRHDLFVDLGHEPSDRGVPLEKPIEFPINKDSKKLADDDAGAKDSDAGRQLSEDENEAGRSEESAGRQDEDNQDGSLDDEQDEAGTLGDTFPFAEFVGHTGWEPSEVYDRATMKTDAGEMTLTKVKEGYNELYAENQRLLDERQQLEAKANQVPAVQQQYAPEAVELMREAEMLQKQYDAIQQDGTLDNMDAGESIKLERKYRYEIERRVKAAQEKQAEHQHKVNEQMQEYLGKVNTQLRKDIPEWRSDKIRKEESSAMAEYLTSEGAERETVEQILKMNPWAARMFRKLWQYERKDAATKKALREVKKVPRSLQPGSKQTPKRQTAADVGKKLNSASRRQWEKTLLTEDFDV